MIIIDNIDGCPAFLLLILSSKKRLNQPSLEYVSVIEKELLELFDMDSEQAGNYLRNQ